MDPSRIAELLDPFFDPANGERLTTNDLEHISTYIDILQRWNARVNLTAICNQEEIVTRHFGESLFTARHLFPYRQAPDATKAPEDAPLLSRNLRQACPERSRRGGEFDFRINPTEKATEHGVPRVSDIGSGAGFPGIPIKLWSPEVHLTLIESNHKKATFLREITRALTLTDVNIQNTRAQSLRGVSFDVVTLRAVERFESILPTAAIMVSPGGRLALLIGHAQLAKAISALPTLTWSAPLHIPKSQSRVLAIATRPWETNFRTVDELN